MKSRYFLVTPIYDTKTNRFENWDKPTTFLKNGNIIKKL